MFTVSMLFSNWISMLSYLVSIPFLSNYFWWACQIYQCHTTSFSIINQTIIHFYMIILKVSKWSLYSKCTQVFIDIQNYVQGHISTTWFPYILYYILKKCVLWCTLLFFSLLSFAVFCCLLPSLAVFCCLLLSFAVSCCLMLSYCVRTSSKLILFVPRIMLSEPERFFLNFIFHEPVKIIF